jgi:hypothetical protein
MIPPGKVFDPARAFCQRFGLRLPILLAPMAGVPAPALSAAVAKAGGMGACGALLMKPEAILAWANDQRSRSNGAFQINLWIPDPAPARDAAHEARLRDFLGRFGPEVPAEAANATPPDFNAQCDALLSAGPAVVSSIMGVYPPDFVAKLKERGIAWFANATTVAEAKAAAEAGADAIVAQGAEAGMRAAWRRLSRWGPRPCRSAPDFCVRPRPVFRPLGPMRWDGRRRRAHASRAPSPAVGAVRSRRITCARPRQPMRQNPHPIPCSAP